MSRKLENLTSTSVSMLLTVLRKTPKSNVSSSGEPWLLLSMSMLLACSDLGKLSSKIIFRNYEQNGEKKINETLDSILRS